MLKISSKQQKIRNSLLNKTYQFFVHHNLKPLLVKSFIPSNYKYFLNLFLLSSNAYEFTKVKNICFLTGRSRSVFRNYKMSRLALRRYAIFKFVIGLSKSTW